MLHVQTNGATRANDGKGNMLRVRTRIAYADECCMFGKLSHVDGKKAMKERKFESLQKKIMKVKNAKRDCFISRSHTKRELK